MPEFKAHERRLQLHRLLARKEKKVVAAQIAKEWACSERTIRRDLNAMRDDHKQPIEYDPVDGTWRYADGKEVVELPAMVISTDDRRALLFSLQAAAQFEGTPVCEQVRRVYTALLATLPPEQATRFERMMKSVRFTGPPTPPISKTVWDVLLLALEEGSTVHMTYRDGNTGQPFARDVDPYGLTMRDRRWLLLAYCHYKEKVRAFALPRIVKIESTDRFFEIPKGFMDAYMANAFDGMQTTGPSVRFVLRIHHDAPPYIGERPWIEGESRRRDADGNTIVEFRTPAVAFVEREVCACAGMVEVLEPAESRQSLRNWGKGLAAAHK